MSPEFDSRSGRFYFYHNNLFIFLPHQFFMEKIEIMRHAWINALATSAYVILVATFIYFISQGLFGQNDTILIPIAMLMLFVFSAAFTGVLVFGRPIIWYLNGKKREALSLLFYTLGIFLAVTFITFLFLILLIS